MKKYYSVFCLLSISFAEPLIQGLVLEQATQVPIASANVSIKGTDMGSASNEYGSFAIDDLSPGSYTFIVTAMGYEKAEIPVTIKRDSDPIQLLLEMEKGVIELDPVNVIKDRASLVGLSQSFLRLPGAASSISKRDLAKFNDTDIHKIIARVPGVYVQEEDGYGLRPNIGMRGTGVERSSKINVMEDGIPIAPAPYASPAAYYSPSAGRMESIEIRKGSSQIKYGPNTTGGALNYISTSIPKAFTIKTQIESGQWESGKNHVQLGNSGETFGYLFESFGSKTSGFKHIENSNLPTGFDKQDYLFKGRFNTPEGFLIPAAIEYKFSETNEISHETYLGLTRTDFTQDPFNRYAASSLDQMIGYHKQNVLTAVIKPFTSMDITAALYKNDFDRNWYKLSKVGGSGISSILKEGNSHSQYALLNADNSDNDDYQIKANNRMYESVGLQIVTANRFSFLGTYHSLLAGIRIHTDEMDRFQKIDKYGMTSGKLMMTTEGIWGTGSKNNRLYEAEAMSYFLEDEISLRNVTMTAGVRFEEIEVKRYDWSGDAEGGNISWNDPDRTLDPALKKKSLQAVVPGIGLVYNVHPTIQMLAGVHKGFSPPGPGVDEHDDVMAEESINIEWGGRYRYGFVRFEALAFHTRYSNLLGDDTQFSGDGTYDQFNAGKVNVDGTELSASYKMNFGSVWLPFSLNYTFTTTQFMTSFESGFEAWGTVERGEELPYIPRHQMFSEVGLVKNNWNMYLRFRHVSSMRTVAGEGDLLETEKTDALSFVDFSGKYKISKKADLFFTINNVLNTQGIVASRPAGVRPSMPRSAMAGITFSY